MTKVGIVVLADIETQGDKGRMYNGLTAAREFKEAGDEVTVIFEGAGTKWVRELEADEGRFGDAFARIKDVAAACRHCASAFDVADAVKASGLPLLDEYATHPSLKRLVDRGYQVITF